MYVMDRKLNLRTNNQDDDQRISLHNAIIAYCQRVISHYSQAGHISSTHKLVYLVII